MPTHIDAKKGDIAETILLPGDPCRAERIAKAFFEKPVCYNRVRGELGFTGHYKGLRVSVQSTGMGMPSAAIYIEELIRDFGVNQLIRVGSAGGMQKNINVGDIVLAQGASTDSSMNKIIFNNIDFAPLADFKLLKTAYERAQAHNVNVHVGNVFSTDAFYAWREELREPLFKHGVLAADMEAAVLYTIAARHNKQALTILTVSDQILTGEATSPAEREETFHEMVEIALETALENQ
jgi:purine-nucleoside phosphorylase